MAYIYLGAKSGQYEDHHTEFGVRYKYTVELSNHLIQQCQSYYYTKYYISFYIEGYPILTNYFDIVICDGSNTRNKGYVKIRYTSNRHYDIGTVCVYYSILFPNEPLVISFKTKNFGTFHHSYSRLKHVKQINNHGLAKDSFKNDLFNLLYKEFRNISSGIIFYTSYGNSAHIKQNPSDPKKPAFIGSKKKFHHITFTTISNVRTGILHTDKLLQKTQNNSFENLRLSDISQSKGLFCDGLIAYYAVGHNLPLYIETIQDCSITQYIRKDQDGTFIKEYYSYDRESAIEALLEEIYNDLVNTLRYKLNINHRYSGSINVNPILSKTYKFGNYKHSPSPGHEKKNSHILYNNHKIVVYSDITSDELFNVQDLVYKTIYTYSLDISSDFHVLIKFIHNDSKIYYVQRLDNSGKYWKKINVSDSSMKTEKTIRSKLDEFSYVLKRSIMVHIDKKPGNYDMYLVDNTDADGYEGFYQRKTSNYKQIKVTEERNCILFKSTKYMIYIHDLSQSKSSSELKDIGGLRLFVTGTQGNSQDQVYKELKLYQDDVSRDSNRIFLSYTPGPGRPTQWSNNDDVYVYFHRDDPRPLMVFYNDKVYRARDENEYQSYKWPVDKNVRSGDCNEKGNINLSNALSQICYHLKIKSCRQESHTSQRTETLPQETHTEASVPEQRPGITTGLHTTTPSKQTPPPQPQPEEKHNPELSKTVEETRDLRKTTQDLGTHRGDVSGAKVPEPDIKSRPGATQEVSQGESVTSPHAETPIKNTESLDGKTGLPKPSPPTLPKSPPKSPPTGEPGPLTKIVKHDSPEVGQSSPIVKQQETRLSIEHTVTQILPKVRQDRRQRTDQRNSGKDSQGHSHGSPIAEAQTHTPASDSSSESQNSTITIAISGTIGVLAVGTVASVLIYFKFPYIIFPAVKAML